MLKKLKRDGDSKWQEANELISQASIEVLKNSQVGSWDANCITSVLPLNLCTEETVPVVFWQAWCTNAKLGINGT